MNIGETVEGLQRFPINVRYPRELRDSLTRLRALPVYTDSGQRIVLADVATIQITDGPPMLRKLNRPRRSPPSTLHQQWLKPYMRTQLP